MLLASPTVPIRYICPAPIAVSSHRVIPAGQIVDRAVIVEVRIAPYGIIPCETSLVTFAFWYPNLNSCRPPKLLTMYEESASKLLPGGDVEEDVRVAGRERCRSPVTHPAATLGGIESRRQRKRVACGI